MWALSIAQLKISTDHLYRLSVLSSGPESFLIYYEYRRLLCTDVHSARQGNSRATPLSFRGRPQPKRRACQKLQPRQTQLHKGNSEIRQFLQPSISACYHSNTVGDRASDAELTLDGCTMCWISLPGRWRSYVDRGQHLLSMSLRHSQLERLCTGE